MEQALRAFKEKGSLVALTDEELKNLPKSFVELYAKEHIQYAWKRIPEEWKESFDKYTYCWQHYPKGRTRIDGPPSMKYCCHGCINSNTPSHV